MPSFFIVICKWHPVVAPFVFLPELSKYFKFSSVSIYFGPTLPIFSFWLISLFFLTKKLGDTWPYMIWRFWCSTMIEYPSAP
jgi:hypothetical protein